MNPLERAQAMSEAADLIAAYCVAGKSAEELEPVKARLCSLLESIRARHRPTFDRIVCLFRLAGSEAAAAAQVGNP